MDKRLKDAGYAILPLYRDGGIALPTHLCVTLNGIELPGSRCTLAIPADAGDAAFLAAEASAFNACEAFAIEHALLDGSELITCELCQGNGDGCRACAGAGAFLADLPAPAPAGRAPFPAELAAPGAVEQRDGPDPFCGDCHGRGCPACREAEAMGLPGRYGAANDSEIGGAILDHNSPDADMVRALASEVRELADVLEGCSFAATQSEPDLFRIVSEAERAKFAARALLRRLGLALAAGLLASGLWAAPAPAGPQAPARALRHVTRPLSSISVKVMPHAAFQGRFRASRAAWAITTADADSCTAWVDGAVPGIEAAELAALKGCRAAIDRAVDAAHAAAEKGGAK